MSDAGGARGDQPGQLRPARPAEAETIDRLMKASIRDLFPAYYDAEQTAASVIYLGGVDRQLIADGTYYVVEVADEVVACGGWSRRAKLYTGSGASTDDDRLLDPATEPAHVRAMFVRADWTRRAFGRRILEVCERDARAEGFGELSVLASLSGVPLYASFGFVAGETIDVRMPNGVTIACVAMQRPIR
jgi:GNAT superfamily N-acetyltransferase